jgi:hypothetical protein
VTAQPATTAVPVQPAAEPGASPMKGALDLLSTIDRQSVEMFNAIGEKKQDDDKITLTVGQYKNLLIGQALTARTLAMVATALGPQIVEAMSAMASHEALQAAIERLRESAGAGVAVGAADANPGAGITGPARG